MSFPGHVKDYSFFAGFSLVKKDMSGEEQALKVAPGFSLR
jgi:hypothetical protein